MAVSQLPLLRPVGVVGRVLCGGLRSPKAGFELSLVREDSLAAAYSDELSAWLPEAAGLRLVAKCEGRAWASVNAFVDAANGRAKTLTIVETENGRSICGGYLDCAWVGGRFMKDPGRRSFIFALKNHLEVPPTRFEQTRDGYAAFMERSNAVYFGFDEGFKVTPCTVSLRSGETYEAPDQGVTLFTGDDSGVFCAARWELWEVE
jgi:hypothetical protein